MDRLITYRIFDDDNKKMNLCLKDINGGLLLVPQFTLAADTKSGTRPGFSTAMSPLESKNLFEYTVNYAEAHYPIVSKGIFGANMQITLCNDGPVTFLIKT
jgi:D-tyrosyl-tRNA(Tyr) deacylase